MKKICVIFLRIFAIYLFARAIQSLLLSLPGIVIGFSQAQSSPLQVWNFISIISSYIFSILIGLLLWIFSENISAFITEEKDSDKAVFNFDIKNIQITVFSAVGLIFIVIGFSKLISNVLSYIHITNLYKILANTDVFSSSRHIIEYKYSLISDGIMAVLGIWLLLGSKGIINLIRKSRNF
jgi:hypothetical protein